MVQNDKPIVKFLNIMVLLSSILVLVIISIELLSATTILSERFILNTHLMVCTIFLADFFVRWYFSQEGWHFLGHHIFLLLISIPYLNIVYISSAHLSHATYLSIVFVIIYFCSIMFYFVEHGPNPMVKDYWDAFNWSLMNVTTVGSNIFGVTKLGQSLAVILAASGMVFFPIFTAFVVDNFQKKRKEAETPTHN